MRRLCLVALTAAVQALGCTDHAPQSRAAIDLVTAGTKVVDVDKAVPARPLRQRGLGSATPQPLGVLGRGVCEGLQDADLERAAGPGVGAEPVRLCPEAHAAVGGLMPPVSIFLTAG